MQCAVMQCAVMQCAVMQRVVMQRVVCTVLLHHLNTIKLIAARAGSTACTG